MLVIDKIIYLFDYKKHNQKELAEYLNIPEGTISEWKSGKILDFSTVRLKT